MSGSEPPRILLLSVSVGSGPVRAAEALRSALLSQRPDAVVRAVDLLQLPGAGALRRTIRRNVERAEENALGKAYITALMDRPASERRMPLSFRIGMKRRQLLRRLQTRLFREPLRALLREEPWDLVISTATFCDGRIVAERHVARKSFGLVRVTTDFMPHRADAAAADRVYVATEEGAVFLREATGAPGRIRISGIPIMPEFEDAFASSDRAELPVRRREGCPLVLQMSGGWGMRSAERILREILRVPRAVDVVVVAGHNEDLARSLEAVEVPPQHRVEVLGFTDRIPDLLGASDVLVSKPGGLTCAEALATGTPMAIVNPLMGPESQNTEHMLECGAAIRIHHEETLAFKLGALLGQPERLRSLSVGASSAARPDAVRTIASDCFEVIDRPASWSS